MIRKHFIGLSLVSVLIAAGCAYVPVSSENYGNYIPEPPPVISEPLNLPLSNLQRRALIPQACRDQGLLGQYWRSDNTILGLQTLNTENEVLSVISASVGPCYDLIRIDNNRLTYPGVNIKYVDELTLEVKVNISKNGLRDYKFVADESFGSLVSIENFSTDTSPVLHLRLKKRTAFAVEFDTSSVHRTEVRLYLAHA